MEFMKARNVLGGDGLLQAQRLLADCDSLSGKVRLVHELIRSRLSSVERVAVALYDAATDALSTFAYSGGESPLLNYSVRLAEVPSLQALAQDGGMRVIHDMAAVPGGSEHSRRLLENGYRSSATFPLYHEGALLGFLFFNARQPHAFTPEAQDCLALFVLVISGAVAREKVAIHTMRAAIRTTQYLTRHKDEETAGHLERMARYAQLIARRLAARHGLDDEFVEYLLLFAPMHDIGKMAIPEHVLLKPARLNDEEFAIIRTHPARGLQIIDQMVGEFGFTGFKHLHMLRSIVGSHHEALDGSGYPAGLKGGDIPLAARICAVADVFDALTSQRPYKPAFSNEESLNILRQMADSAKLDEECVNVLWESRDDIEGIQRYFKEDTQG